MVKSSKRAWPVVFPNAVLRRCNWGDGSTPTADVITITYTSAGVFNPVATITYTSKQTDADSLHRKTQSMSMAV